jgi:hypothetical protein
VFFAVYFMRRPVNEIKPAGDEKENNELKF